MQEMARRLAKQKHEMQETANELAKRQVARNVCVGTKPFQIQHYLKRCVGTMGQVSVIDV